MDSQPAPVASAVGITGNHKIWTLLCHLSVFVGLPFLLPLVVYLAMKDDSEYVRRNAAEALNFHITMFIYAFCSFLLVFLLIGIPLLFAVGVFTIVMAIIAAVRASDGECYRYPLTIHFL